MSAYAELAVTTNFSFLRGASDPEEFVAQAKLLGLAGLGIADRNSVAGVVRAHIAARELAAKELQQAGHDRPFKVVVGARLVFADGTPDILAYPRHRAAWGRLTRLLSLGKRRAEKGDCILRLSDLLDHAEGFNLIVMPGRRNKRSSPSPGGGGSARGARRGGVKVTAQQISSPPPAGLRPATSPLQGEVGTDRGERALVSLLVRLKEAAPRSVWLAAGMLYRGDDARRLRGSQRSRTRHACH